MKALFAHGLKFFEDENGKLYLRGYNHEYWDRYLKHFNELYVIGRKINMSSEEAKGYDEFYGAGLRFIEVPEIHSPVTYYVNNGNCNSIIYDLVRNVDYVITRLPGTYSSKTIRYCKKQNKPYLIELVGCPWDALWNHSLKGKCAAPFMYFNTRNSVKDASYVLYVTDEFLQRRYPSKGRTIGCSNVALPISDESVLESRLHKIKQMTNYKPIVLGTTAAVDVRYKGQEYVIKAIAELNKQGFNFEYRLVGGGEKDRLQSIAEKNGVADKVIFEGSMSHEKVFGYLDNINIYIQPSKTEGLPRALIEAMSRGCPCIGSNAGGIPELLDNAYIFSRGNFKELATILANFDNEKMIKQAKRNFKFSKGYAKEVIETRRNKFFKDFAESVRNS